MTYILEAIDVSKVFSSRRGQEEVVALKDLSVQIRKGEFFSIVGASGCGKSTFLNMIAGLEFPSSGQLLFYGTEIKGPSPERGMCFQDYSLFPWKTVLDNVAFGLKARGVPKTERYQQAQQYIEMVNLKGFENRYPYELSGGMKQRCALARMLCNDPSMLLMDEPLAALDAQTREILQDEILRIWGEDVSPASDTKKTVVYITHNIDEAVYLSDRIMVMSRSPGRVKAIIDNDFPRPREGFRRTEEFRNQVDHIWSLIKEEAKTAISG